MLIKSNAIRFYEKKVGKKVVDKEAKIGDKLYEEYGFYFNLEDVLKYN